VVDSFELKEAKTKAFREALDALNVDKTALIVDAVSKDGNRNLELSSRNLEGVEVTSGNRVHPYHLLRYERAIFAKPALERLQESLKKTASERAKQPKAAKKASRKKEVA